MNRTGTLTMTNFILLPQATNMHEPFREVHVRMKDHHVQLYTIRHKV